jgi:carbonic anhydrase
MNPHQALIDGYRRFRLGRYQEQRLRFDALAKGQSPRIMVIACSDSRVDPATVFDTEPGQIFVVRNVANLVPPFETGGGRHGVSAALEFAVTQLQVEEIVVMGHGGCGGIAASLTGRFEGAEAGEGGFISRWMEIIAPARDRIREAAKMSPDIDAQRALEQSAIRISIENLRAFPFVARALAEKRLRLTGAFFAISDGVLHLLDPEQDRFVPVEVATEPSAA